MRRLNNHDFYVLFGEALVATDRDAFASDWALSSIWGDAEQIEDDELPEIAEYVGRVYDIAHMTMRDIVKASGMTQAAFAERLCAPKRTVECWCSKTASNAREPADWLRLLIARELGLIER